MLRLLGDGSVVPKRRGKIRAPNSGGAGSSQLAVYLRTGEVSPLRAACYSFCETQASKRTAWVTTQTPMPPACFSDFMSEAAVADGQVQVRVPPLRRSVLSGLATAFMQGLRKYPPRRSTPPDGIDVPRVTYERCCPQNACRLPVSPSLGSLGAVFAQFCKTYMSSC